MATYILNEDLLFAVIECCAMLLWQRSILQWLLQALLSLSFALLFLLSSSTSYPVLTDCGSSP